jgi:fluoride exporter
MEARVNRQSGVQPSFAAECAAVYVGGVAGALARYGIVEAFGSYGGKWPWPTFIANIAGCAILGYVIAKRASGSGSDIRIALLGTGFCGALTTFSTFQLELYNLVDAGSYWTAIAYLAASIYLGLIAVGTARRYVERGKELA